MKITRRKFLQGSTAVGAVIAVLPFMVGAASQPRYYLTDQDMWSEGLPPDWTIPSLPRGISSGSWMSLLA